MLCAQVFLALSASNTKGVDTTSAVYRTGHYYFVAFPSVTWVDLRAFSRSNRDLSSGGVAGMVLARRSQCDNSRRGADLDHQQAVRWAAERTPDREWLCGGLALSCWAAFMMGPHPKSEIRRR